MAICFVTSASGITGGKVVQALIKKGHKVRAGVKSLTSSAEHMKKLGAEVVEFQFSNPDSYDEALKGVERVILICPMIESDIDKSVITFLDFAKQSGIKYILKLSIMGANPNAKNNSFAQNHGIIDEAVKKSGIPYTIVMSSIFMHNILKFIRTYIVQHNSWVGSAYEGKVAYISADDVAELIAEIASSPEKHFQKTYNISGKESFTQESLAPVIGEAFNRPVKYENVPGLNHAEVLKSIGVHPRYIQPRVDVDEIIRSGGASTTTNTFQDILGKEPEPLKSWLKRSI